MRFPLPAADFPAEPYPGVMPDWSFAAAGAPGEVWPLRADPGAPSGWRLDVASPGADLDDWLAGRAEMPLAQRIPVMSYGSNRCPSKIDWLRSELGLTGTVIALRVRVRDVAAVWAAGIRQRDDQRPATLAASHGAVEDHMVWLASPAQLRVLDVCEGRGVRYRLVRLHSGIVEVSGGPVLPAPWTYVAAEHQSGAPGGSATVDSRLPLLVDGAPVRCAALTQASARALIGQPASTDGLTVVEVAGAPNPLSWPEELFVYGSLRPGDSAWSLLEPEVAEPPRRAAVAGTLVDTGTGYPGLNRSAPGRVSGWLLRLRDPAAALPALDHYEGPGYRRVRLVAADGTLCWAYLWSPQTDDGTATR